MHATEAFLNDFHAQFPGATSLCFAEAADASGRSSYDLLIERIADPCRVLDLACGDGWLLSLLKQRHPDSSGVGVDMSRAELDAARVRLGAAAELHLARAQSLPLGTDSVDVITCHLALMLMTELDAVVAEVERVLVAGGRFLAIVPAKPSDPPFASAFYNVVRELMAAENRRIQFADRRAWSPEGLAELLPRFDVSTTPVLLNRPISVDELWEFFQRGWYIVDLLSVESKAKLKETIERDLAPHAIDGELPWTFSFTVVDARRRQ